MARNRKPSVLFLAYTFPPAKNIGSVRTWNIAKYLARSGWEVSVVTLDPSVWRDVEGPEATEISLGREGIERLSTDHQWRWLAPDMLNCSNQGVRWFLGGVGRRIGRRLGIDKTVGWVAPAERACSMLTAKDVDVVLASGPPFSAFTLAQRLSDRLGCPYVLDYRDLWSRNLHDSPQSAAVGKEEAAVLTRCAAVTTVSASWAAVMDRQFGIGPKLHVISNGYDAEDLAKVEPHDFGHFAMVYTGVFYPPRRVVSPVMAALRCLNETVNGQRQWRFHYYGKDECHVWEEAKRFGVTSRVITHGTVPRSQALAALKGGDVAVVITSIMETGTTEDNGMITGKIFEAIGLRTPILLIAPPASDANAVIEATGLSSRLVASDTDGIAAFLKRLMDCPSRELKNADVYSWERLIQSLDGVLRKAAGL